MAQYASIMPEITRGSQSPGAGTQLPTATVDADRISAYLSDESSALTGHAEKAFLPEHADHVAAVLRAAHGEGKKVTISAAGTSLTGARVPVCGGWVLSIERMRHVKAAPDGFDLVRYRDFSFYLNPATRQAVAPAGITLAEFNEALARYKLVYPPDPTEATAMLGGTVATNASGARSFYYQPTRHWVRGLEVVLPSGEVLDLKRGEHRALAGALRSITIPDNYPVFTTKNAAGLYLAEGMDPVDLFIGSEGILGVITAVRVGLVPLPEDILTCVAFFSRMDDALGFADRLREVRSGGAVQSTPLSIEFFDGRALRFMRDAYPEIPERAAGAILFEIEHRRRDQHNPYPARTTLAPWVALLNEYKAITDWTVTGREILRIKQFRHALPEAVNTWVRARVGKLGTDMAVPPGHFRTMVEAYEAAENCGVRTVIFGHIGDCHLHLNFLPENQEELAAAKKRYLELARLAVRLGGTISAEHGVGKKTIQDEQEHTVPYLEVMLGRAGLGVIHGVKRALDPRFTLNPGNMVPEEYC